MFEKSSNPVNILNFPKRKGRKITVDSVTWKWTCGKGGTVVAYSENGERLQDHAANVKCMSIAAFDRGREKRTKDGELTPKHVAKWLKTVSEDPLMKECQKQEIKKKQEINKKHQSMSKKFFVFNQNNSRGETVHIPEKGIGNTVIIQAHDADQLPLH